MTSRRWLVLAVLVGLLVWSTGHQRAGAQTSTQTITINYSAANGCSQSPAAPADVYQNQTVTFVTPNSASFQIGFSSCPFGSCPVSGSNGTSGALTLKASAVGNTYYASSATIGGQSCNNPGALGVRVH